MNFQQAIQSGFSNYANFRGRASRSEFWWFQLFILLGEVAAVLVDVFGNFTMLDGSPLATVFWLATIIPDLAVMARRLHDTDASGWWLLLMLIPLIGMVVLIVWWCLEGSKGYNRFGAEPLQPALIRPTASSRPNR
jgi:uncharacterized membrane protein YhaH (DUF805 family)